MGIAIAGELGKFPAALRVRPLAHALLDVGLRRPDSYGFAIASALGSGPVTSDYQDEAMRALLEFIERLPKASARADEPPQKGPRALDAAIQALAVLVGKEPDNARELIHLINDTEPSSEWCSLPPPLLLRIFERMGPVVVDPLLGSSPTAPAALRAVYSRT